MSFVVANAFAIDHCDLPRIHAAIEETRAIIKPMARKAHASLVAQRTCYRIDRDIAFDRPWQPSPLGTVWSEVDEESRGIEATGLRNPLSDFGFEISLVPDPETASTYGVIHCEHDAWRRVWMRRPEVRDFSFDNRSDRPSSVRVAEWRLREQTWDRILPSGILSEHGMSVSITPSRLIRTLPDPMRYQPSLEARKRHVARDVLMDRIMSEDPDLHEDGGLVRAVMNASSRMREPAMQERLAGIEADLRLPRRITMAIAVSRTRPENLDLV